MLWLGDAAELLCEIDPVDVLVMDPPYGIGESSKNFASRGKPINSPRSRSRELLRATDYGAADWDDQPVSAELMAAVRAKAKWQVIFGGNYYALPPTSCWLVWDKLNGDSDFADCELAWTNLPKAVRRIRFLWNGCMRRERDIAREHPTQKPVEVMKWCIGHVPAPNQTIFDPFAGSGTTGVAAIQMARKFIGIERDPKYFDIMCRRVEEAAKQPDLLYGPGPVASEPQQLSLMEPAE